MKPNMLYKSDIEEMSVCLRITDFDCSADEITEQLDVQPSEVRIKGEYRSWGTGKHKTKILNRNNEWILKSSLPQTVDPDEHLEFILNIIRPKKNKFLSVLKKYRSEFSFGIYFHNINPGMNLNNKLLKEISDLNSEIDIDMYFLRDRFN